MARSIWRGALAGLLVATGCVLLPGTASAQDTCDMDIVDTTASHVDQNDSVNGAVNRLKALGADVRVRVLASTPNGVDAYEGDQERACSSWRGSNDKRKANLVSVLVDLGGHRTAILYGDDYLFLNGFSERVQAGTMIPLIKSGQTAQGVTAGIDALTQRINEVTNPSAAQPPVDTGAEPAPVPNNGPSAGTVFAWVFGVIGALLLLALLIFGVPRLWGAFNTRRTNRLIRESDLAKARSDARTAKIKAATLLLAVDGIDRAQLSTQADYFVRYLTGTAASQISDQLNRTLQALQDATANYGAYATASGSDNDPDTETKRPIEHYRSMAKSYTELAAELSRAQQLVVTLEKLCSETRQQIDQFPILLETLRTRFLSLETRISTTERSGLRATEVAALLQTARNQADEAGAAFERHDLAAARTQLEVAQATLDQASQMLDELPKRCARLTEQLGQQSQALAINRAQLNDAGSVLEQLRATTIQASWSNLPEVIKAARAALAQQTDLLQQASRQLDEQNWSEAERLLNESAKLTTTVSSAVRAVNQRQNDWQTAVVAAPKLAKEARVSLEKARTQVNTRQGDQSGPTASLDQAEENLVTLEQQLKGRPDYLDLQDRLRLLQKSIVAAESASQRTHTDKLMADRRRTSQSRSRTSNSPHRTGPTRTSGPRNTGRSGSSTTIIGGGYYDNSSSSSGWGSSGGDGGGGSVGWGNSGGDSGGGSVGGGDGGGGSVGW